MRPSVLSMADSASIGVFLTARGGESKKIEATLPQLCEEIKRKLGITKVQPDQVETISRVVGVTVTNFSRQRRMETILAQREKQRRTLTDNLVHTVSADPAAGKDAVPTAVQRVERDTSAALAQIQNTVETLRRETAASYGALTDRLNALTARMNDMEKRVVNYERIFLASLAEQDEQVSALSQWAAGVDKGSSDAAHNILWDSLAIVLAARKQQQQAKGG